MSYKFTSTPFNLDLLVLTKDQIKRMRPVTKLNIMVSSSSNFEPDGLFSTEIFGEPGSTERNSTFSYIKRQLPVLHPLIYKHIITAKALYKNIMSGKSYAVFDNDTKDLVLSNEQDGRTGYSFFLEMLPKIQFDDRNSDLRKFKIYMIEKYGMANYMITDFLVLPAGMRDYYINASGKPEEDDINNLYRKLLILESSIANITVDKDTMSMLDNIRFKAQETINEIYSYIMSLLDGKRKFIQAKWGTRGIIYGTRNVITPSIADVKDLNVSQDITIDHTTIGLYQYLRAITPIAMNKIHNKFISRIFNPESSQAYLINKKSLSTELTSVTVKDKNNWLTIDGLDDIIGTMVQEDTRSIPIMVGDHYMCLLYDTGKEIEVIFNTDALDDSIDKKKLRPITYYELFYISILDIIGKYPGFLTRYPVINLGGIYPSKTYVKTTIKGRNVKVKISGTEYTATEYPNYKENFYNSLSPHYAFLNALGGDYDGDKCSYSIVYEESSIAEINDLLDSRGFYTDPKGDFVFSPDTGTLNFVIASLNSGKVYD